jgi:hypothetical protein
MRCFQGSLACDGLLNYTFQFESTFAVPRTLLEGDISDVQSYLLQFQRLLDAERGWIQKEGAGEAYKRAEADVRGELRGIVEGKEREISRLVRDLEAARTAAKVAEAEAEAMRAAGRAEEESMRARLEVGWRERLGELKAVNEQNVALLREQLEAARTENRGLADRIIGREAALKSSQGRGRIGEDAFAEAAAVYAGWSLERIAGQARACDFKMRVNSFDCRFEIKNHNTPIPLADVQKFQRDMEEHRAETGVGIFIALNVGLALNKGQLIHHEWKESSGQLLVYVSAFNDNDPGFIFMVLRHLIEVYGRFRDLYDAAAMRREELEVAAELEALKGRIDSAMIHIQSMGRHMKELRLKVIRDKKTVTKIFDDSLELLKSMQNEYDMSLSLLLGTSLPVQEEETTPSLESPVVAPVEPPPKKPRSRAKKVESPQTVISVPTAE